MAANLQNVTPDNFDEWWQLLSIHVQRHTREERRRQVLSRLDSQLASLRESNNTEH